MRPQMRAGEIRTAAASDAASLSAGEGRREAGRGSPRSGLMALSVALAFVAVGGQSIRLALRGQDEPTTSMSQAVPTSFARPDIVDRNGRLLASDVEMPSLYADPALVLDRDEVAEKLARVLPELDEAEVRRLLADRSRRFVWLRRGLSPKLAQAVHDLGLPGLAFRRELKRAYPAGALAGHLIGAVNVDNRGLAGIERHLDESGSVEPVHGATLSGRAPLRTSLDLGAQHALDEELKAAMRRYDAKGAAGVVMDAVTGEVVAAQSLPGADPARVADLMDDSRQDKLTGSVFELGSIVKMATVAMAIDGGQTTADSVRDVRQPLQAGRFTIRDLHPAGRPLTVAEIFIRSSNVGAGMLALEAGADRQRAFFERLGLITPIRTESGPVAAPLLPAHWNTIETITLSYGHGMALAPMQFAAAAAGLVNGGTRVTPTLLRKLPGEAARGERMVSPETSRVMRDLMRRNVTDAAGTGRRAAAAGYRVGGKTGTAELPVKGGYRQNAVISSFLGAFPMEAPRYVALVMLFEPKPTREAQGHVTAGNNAAPTAARLIERIAPILGVMPAGAPEPVDDGTTVVDPGDGPAATFEAPVDAGVAGFDGVGDAKY